MPSLFKGPKDAALSKLGQVLINKFGMARYGTLTSLALDSRNKTLRMSLMLKGEMQPIDLEARYRVENEPGGKRLVIESAECSREWATYAFNDFCPPEARRIQLPPFADLLL